MPLRLKKYGLGAYCELCDENERDPSMDGIPISGSPDEWLAIASAIERGEGKSFTRCAAYRKSHYWDFVCPRNGSGARDAGVTLFDGEEAEFIAHVRATFPAGTYDLDNGIIGLAGEREVLVL